MTSQWPQTEIFRTKEALLGLSTFIKKGNFTLAFRSSSWTIQDLRPMVLASFTLNWEYSITSSSCFFQCKYPTFHVKLTSKSQGWKYVGRSNLVTQHNKHEHVRGLSFMLRCDGMMAFSNMYWKCPSLHCRVILNSPRQRRRRVKRECFNSLTLPLFDQFPRSSWSLYSPGIPD